MKSKWFEYKEQARSMRKEGISMTVIEHDLGIPRSTLSGWFKDITLSEAQRTRLMKNRQDGWKKARENAVKVHNQMKKQRIMAAEEAAHATLTSLTLTNELLDITFAMLYLGEGSKNNTTSIANSNPMVLRFVLSVLYKNYGVKPTDIRCDLHLRADQDGDMMKVYWSEQLLLPIECFKYIAYDKRTAGRRTYDTYMGVCVVTCHQIAIQRKIVSLYNQFCKRVSNEIMGV